MRTAFASMPVAFASPTAPQKNSCVCHRSRLRSRLSPAPPKPHNGRGEHQHSNRFCQAVPKHHGGVKDHKQEKAVQEPVPCAMSFLEEFPPPHQGYAIQYPHEREEIVEIDSTAIIDAGLRQRLTA